MRRWRGLKARRGVFFGGAASSPVPPQWTPPVTRARPARAVRARHGVLFAVPAAAAPHAAPSRLLIAGIV